MPTGYTQKLCEKGQTFKEFAFTCAHAFGALVTMRENAIDTPIPTFEPDDGSAKEAVKAEAEKKRLLAMTKAQKRAFGAQLKRHALKSLRDWLKRDMVVNKRLNGMRLVVQGWKPPTANHEGLKKFMLEQLAPSTDDLQYIHRQIEEANASSPMEYYAQAVSSAQHDIEYGKEAYKAEVGRTKERNEWVDQLRESLK